MRIFSTAPEGNEMAELENARYINLALRQIEENVEWLKTANKPVQAVMTHIDILVSLAKRFPVNANLLIPQFRSIILCDLLLYIDVTFWYLSIDLGLFWGSWFLHRHKIPHPNQWGT